MKPVTFRMLRFLKAIFWTFALGFAALIGLGLLFGEQPQPQVSNAILQPGAIQATETKEEAVPFQKETRADPTKLIGESAVVQQGVNGTRTLTYSVVRANGQELERVLLSAKESPGLPEVTAVGTKPTPRAADGTYQNTYGNYVPRPGSYDSAPADASAQCADGTYSFSQSRRGTCSHHGGVARWL